MARAASAAVLFLAFACTDATQRAPTGTSADPSLAIAGTSGTLSLPLEPAGYTRLTERAFNSKARSGSDDAGAEGWLTSESKYSAFSIRSDTAAPQSPSRVGRVHFPAGFRGDQSPVIAGYDFTYQGYRQLYVSVFVKVSPSWQGPSRNISSFFVARAAFEPRVQIGVRGQGSGTLVPAVRFLWTPKDRIITPNLQSSAVLRRGQWQRWDLILRINSPGAADGELHWWANGTKIAEYRDIAVVEKSERNAWDAIELRPFWGGSLDVVESGMNLFVDHAYVSGSKTTDPVTAPSPTTPPAPAAVAQVDVSPATLALLAGKSGQLTAVARDSAGNVLTGRAVTWTSANSGIAKVSTSGVVTAVAAGSVDIVATVEGIASRSVVTVTNPVARVTVSPANLALEVGATRQLSATAYDPAGNVLTGRAVTWSSGNPAVATVSASGLATAVASGSTNIVAKVEGITGQAAVTVTAPALTLRQVILTPSSVTLDAGAKQQFVASGRMSDGSTSAVSVTFSATGGTISSGGVYTAGSTSGTYRVIARESTLGLADTSTVQVMASVPPPTGSTEPQLGSTNTVIFRDDFETYDGTCRSMDVSSGGPWRTAGGTCGTDPNGVISSPSGTGYVGSTSGVGGRSARFIWPESTQEQFIPLEAPVNGFGGRGQAEYFSYMYRAPGFIYRTSYPRLGKKMFLLFVGDGSTGRVTINPSEFSIMQSNGVKIDSRFDRWPAGLGSEEAFLSYLTDGRWHRYTIMRLPETTTGAMNGALRVWVDGYLVIDRTNFGTFSGATSSFILAGTFNGGSSKLQTEYYDSIRAWR